MKAEADAVRILCFGDSNTHGLCRLEPGVEGTPTPDPYYVRLDADRRWPGVCQQALGDGYEVIEEGLNGRTTDVDDPGRPGLAGRSYLVPCLLSHSPLNVVILMLGLNDLKSDYARTPEDVAQALGGLVDDVAVHATDRRGGAPITVLVGTTPIDDTATQYRDLVGDDPDPRHSARARELDACVRDLAHERGLLYVAASEVARPGEDGIHLDVASHTRLGELVAQLVRDAVAGA